MIVVTKVETPGMFQIARNPSIGAKSLLMMASSLASKKGSLPIHAPIAITATTARMASSSVSQTVLICHEA